MPRGTTARIAGFTFLFYIVVGVTELVLRSNGTSADGTAVRLTGIGQQASALVLAVTLYMLTNDAGPVLAMVAMACRVLEGLGSTLFAYLFLRGRMIPAALAWPSRIGLPRRDPSPAARRTVRARVELYGAVTGLMWLPMLVFEVTLALWLIVKGVPMPARRATT